ncbi:MAG: hypothetical protein JWO87_2101 [Phycisphaerales bacterium]|jgi:hypothetical protein|nr:hypothetical protein [Phycisphaerales bacterium]MDB5300438.1 hypothetical protein [Phycisphaerales bacterium]
MPQLFHPAMNTVARLSIFGTIFLTAGIGWMAWGYERSSYITRQGDIRPQPVPFSHEHHVRGLGIDCRYCHTSVEDSYFAGLPATKVCMTCHSQMWNNAPLLQPVRDSWANNRPIIWNRVHNLPNFVYFNHSIHVNKGVGCVSCHGQVDMMPLVWKNSSLFMEWCLECHREPERVLRPREEVFNLHYDPAHDPKHPGETQLSLGLKLKEQYHLLPREQLQNCSTCHR